MEIAIGVAVTVGLAVSTGLCWLAFNDTATFRRLAWAIRPSILVFASIGFGVSVGGSAFNFGATANQISLWGLAIVAGSIGIFALFASLLWLREGKD